jgi:hypothetical protein
MLSFQFAAAIEMMREAMILRVCHDAFGLDYGAFFSRQRFSAAAFRPVLILRAPPCLLRR